MVMGAGNSTNNILPGLRAGSDLSSSQYCFVKFDTDPLNVVICGAGEQPCGVLQNAPTSGLPASVQALDGSEGWLVVDGSTILVTSVLKSDASGYGTVTTSDNDVIGARAREASSAASRRWVQYTLGSRY